MSLCHPKRTFTTLKWPLAYAIVELNNPESKEILTFVLAERLDNLYRLFHASETDKQEGMSH
ncbi:hypothetical protein [Pectobacterium parmentieri]|uniref:hypothetical protein n=1 Tax=Pectobacterium parmentieri TaxID=1905730 RepID=UPI002B247D15|nr:hypothetical protein [Pectobacterium parmentieri]MBI0551005.1 hypothetical protein [Pectobacterium parmentieri]MBI0560039.1 hypothetical protein [Pectobacterium parmentieri]MBI0565171.1 hypothetical protein [Pectobacterium parmentieri]